MPAITASCVPSYWSGSCSSSPICVRPLNIVIGPPMRPRMPSRNPPTSGMRIGCRSACSARQTIGKATSAARLIATAPHATSEPVSRSMACGLPYAGRSNCERRGAEEVHRDRAGPRGGHREEQPIPQRSAALRDGDDAGEEQCRRDRRAEQRPDGRRTRDEDRDLRGNLRKQPCEQRHGDADVDRDDRVLGAEAHTAGEAQDGHQREARKHSQSQRRPDELGRRRIGPAVAGHEPQPDAHGESREGEDQHDPPAVRVDAERVGQRVPEHAAQQVGHLLQGPQEERRERAHDDRGDREQQELSRGRTTIGRRSRKAHRALLPVGCGTRAAHGAPHHARLPRVERSAQPQWTSRRATR